MRTAFSEEEIFETREKPTSQLSAREFFYKYLHYLPLFLLCLALALLGAYLYLRYASFTYRVNAKLLIKQDNNKAGSNDLENVVFFQKAVNLDNEIEILQSRTLMQRVVKSQNLQVVYWAKGNIRTTEIYDVAPFIFIPLHISDSSRGFQLTVKLVDNDQFALIGPSGDSTQYHYGQLIQKPWGQGKLFAKPGGYEDKEVDYVIQWQPASVLAQQILSSLTIKPVTSGSTILLLTLETQNQRKGEDILNRLMKEYDALNVEDNNRIADNTINFITDRLEFISQGLDSVENSLKNFRVGNQVIDLEKQTGVYFDQYNELNTQLTEQEVKLRILNMLDDYVKQSDKKYQLVPTNLVVDDVTLAGLIQAYNQLQLKRNLDLQSIPKDNPIIRNDDTQLEDIRTSLVENINTIRKSYQTLRNNLEQQASRAQGMIQSVPLKSQELLQINRQRGIKETIYEYLLQKREEAEISKASTVANSRLVDAAVGSGGPISPNRTSIFRLAILIGLVLPVAIIFLREQLNDKITNRHDITRNSQIPIVGEIGHSMKPQVLIATSNSRDVVAEQFRVVRTNLQFLLHKADKPVIMITSSVSGEGKSFVGTNIAAVFALMGKRTVVLEFDLRKPKIASNLNIGRKEGITNYLVGKISEADLPKPVQEMDNLYVISSGPIPPNPAELLLDEKMPKLFQYLKENFDVVIVDTAPVGLVSDAQVLSAYTNATLYVVRQRYTLKKQMNLINELYQQQRLPNMGLLVNDVAAGGVYGYYGYGKYGYGYGYGYGSGYYDEPKPKPWYKRLLRKLGLKRN